MAMQPAILAPTVTGRLRQWFGIWWPPGFYVHLREQHEPDAGHSFKVGPLWFERGPKFQWCVVSFIWPLDDGYIRSQFGWYVRPFKLGEDWFSELYCGTGVSLIIEQGAEDRWRGTLRRDYRARRWPHFGISIEPIVWPRRLRGWVKRWPVRFSCWRHGHIRVGNEALAMIECSRCGVWLSWYDPGHT